MGAFLAKPLIKWGGIALGAIGLVVGALWYIGSERSQARKDGAATETVKVQERTIVIQKEIQRAEDRGPRTRRDVSDRLRDGTF